MAKFDLNIDTILENWQPEHALREVIANAIDEQLLTQSQDVEIAKDPNGAWYVRDYGRGLQYTHLRQNENIEKLNNPLTIGKFGIGLKDALATFERHGIGVLSKSKYGDISLTRSEKDGFSDVVTLHAVVKEPSEPYMTGTIFVLRGVTDDQVKRAKNLFLRFSGDTIIDTTEYGQIIGTGANMASVYINGVKAAEEPTFLFGYNITSLTASIRKALNRERTNVGRTAYFDRIKAILLASQDRTVAEHLARDLEKFSRRLFVQLRRYEGENNMTIQSQLARKLVNFCIS